MLRVVPTLSTLPFQLCRLPLILNWKPLISSNPMLLQQSRFVHDMMAANLQQSPAAPPLSNTTICAILTRPQRPQLRAAFPHCCLHLRQQLPATPQPAHAARSVERANLWERRVWNYADRILNSFPHRRLDVQQLPADR